MAKRRAAKKKPVRTAAVRTAPRPKSVDGLRKSIDRLDRDLVRLVNDRAKLALEIGKLKCSAGEDIYVPCREEEVLDRAEELSNGPLTDLCIRAIFRELISGSRSLEKTLRVSYLGPDYSYSHLAATHRFGQSVEFLPVATIGAVFEEVNCQHADFGLVPLENSTDGRIADTLDMFTRLPVKICGEVQMRIHHTLLAMNKRAEITEVYSRPQALSQCRNWLARHLPKACVIEVSSTSTAAQLAKEKKGVAAIASLQAGIHHGLDVLASNIEDNKLNLTRFAVISQVSAKRTGRDKTSLMFEIDHSPGSLADSLAIFKRNRLNLTWIESFPIPDQEGTYLFFAELAGHESDAKLVRSLTALKKRTRRLVVLGSYPRSSPID